MEIYKLKPEDVDVKVEYVGAPRYRVILEGEDYKSAEKVLKKLTDGVLKKIKKLGGTVTNGNSPAKKLGGQSLLPVTEGAARTYDCAFIETQTQRAIDIERISFCIG